MRLHNHREVWPLWPIRLRWSRWSSPAGTLHWIKHYPPINAADRRPRMTTVLHLGRLKVIFGQP
jgi:hypothetical protein